jgi:hypothetical protein
MTTPQCCTYWGSHGCSLPEGHPGVHVCGDPDTNSTGDFSGWEVCCIHDGKFCFWLDEDGERGAPYDIPTFRHDEDRRPAFNPVFMALIRPPG